MKKVFSLLLAIVMLLSLAACTGTSGNGGGGSAADGDGTNAKTNAVGVDMSKYPADINEWTTQNMVDYFIDAGVFTNDDETWIQDHETYWAGTPVYEASGRMDNEGLIMIMIFTFSADNPSSTPEEVETWMDTLRETKMVPQDNPDLMMPYEFDHMIGNFAFCYGLTVDEDVYNAMDEAYNALVESLGVTPDF